MDLAKFVKPYPCKIKDPKTPQQEIFKIAYPRQRSMIEESSCVIYMVLPLFKQKYAFDNPNGFGLMSYGAAWALIENILLAATYEGLGTPLHIPVKKETHHIKNFMKIPYNYYLPAMIMLGYTSENALVPKQVEANVDNKVHWNKW